MFANKLWRIIRRFFDGLIFNMDINNMKRSDFWYYLPEDRIAQTPLQKRDSSKLMVLNRANHSISHNHFHDLVDILSPGDLLVLNNSRALPARLYGNKIGTGGKMEFLLLVQDKMQLVTFYLHKNLLYLLFLIIFLQ